jgi:hypothetical protein
MVKPKVKRKDEFDKIKNEKQGDFKMAKLIKYYKKVLIIIGIFCVLILIAGTILTNINREGINWEDYERVKPEIAIQRFMNQMPKSFKKKIFKELVQLQDRYSELYPYDNEKQQFAYKQIAKRYKYSEEIIRRIAIEGAKSGWIYDMK